MAITRTLILNAVLLCLPPMIILGVFKFFFVRHIRWAAGVVALIDVVIFQTQLFYYESIWLVLFGDSTGNYRLAFRSALQKILSKMKCPKIEAIQSKTRGRLGYFCNNSA